MTLYGGMFRFNNCKKFVELITFPVSDLVGFKVDNDSGKIKGMSKLAENWDLLSINEIQIPVLLFESCKKIQKMNAYDI